MRAWLGVFVLAIPVSAMAQTTFVGGGPAYQEMTVNIEGTPRTVVQLTGYFHQMDLAPHHAQPIGLGEAFYVVKDEKPWNASHCETWIKQIQGDELAWNEKKTMFPYWEIQIAADAKPYYVDGMPVWHDRDVSCWEAMDFGPPLF